MNLQSTLGNIDIYLLDQILRGNVPAGARVLDAGCGSGRNLRYFLRTGDYDVHGADREDASIDRLRALAEALGAPSDESRFRVEGIEELSFDSESFDFVICNAVLHFAADEDHFQSMVEQLHRVLRAGGICFCRLASTISVEAVVRALPERPPRWHHLPDGSDRFLVDLELLLATTGRLDAELVDPVKTVNVQNRRAMTNWVWRKDS